MRSAEPLGSSGLKPAWEAFLWLVAYDNWAAVVQVLYSDGRKYPLAALGVLLLLCGVGLGWYRSRRYLSREKLKAGGSQDNFGATVQALLATLLVAAPIPLFVWLVAWRLLSSNDVNPVVAACGVGLRNASFVLAPLLFLTQLTSRHGLGVHHFRWKHKAIAPLWRMALLLAASLPLLVFLFFALDASGQPAWSHSLGRLGFVLSAVLIVYSAHRGFRSARDRNLENKTDGAGVKGNRLRLLLYPIVVMIPLMIGSVAVIGYYYSAIHLAE
ncbi:MAG: hypothetical protein ACYTGQ_14650, partial [Planctomycetota bacterium]